MSTDHCPFCGEKWKTETYAKGKGRAPSFIAFCDNDECPVKPSTVDGSPTAAYRDVEAIGRIGVKEGIEQDG